MTTPKPTIMLFTFIAATVSLSNMAAPSALGNDPCDQVIQQACFAPLIQDPTGESSQDHQGPIGYVEAKKKSVQLLNQKLSDLAKTPEWKNVIEFAKQSLKPNGGRLSFQNPTLEKQLNIDCSVDVYSETCVRAAVELLVSEIQFTIFASTDILYRKANVSRFGRNMMGSSTWLGGPITEEELGELPLGTMVSTMIILDLENQFSSLRKIRGDIIRSIIQDLLPRESDLKRLENNIIPDVKAMLLDFISEQPKGTAAYEKLKSVEFSSLDLESYRKSGRLFETLISNAMYNSQTNKFEFLPGFIFHNTSAFGQIFLTAHELTHAVDPCFFGKPTEGQFWLPKAISCLRNRVGVFDRTEKFGVKPPLFCDPADQLGESTADFVASEILGRYLTQKWSSLTGEMRINAVAQALRPFRCDLLPVVGDPHLSTKARYQRIILANPTVREYLGCRMPSKYTCE